MLPYLVRRPWGTPHRSINTNIFKLPLMVTSRFASYPHRHMATESAAAVAPANPPCIARVFDRTTTRKDELHIPANYGTHAPPRPVKSEESNRGEEFWREIAPYKDVSANEFLSWAWSTKVRMTSPGSNPKQPMAKKSGQEYH